MCTFLKKNIFGVMKESLYRVSKRKGQNDSSWVQKDNCDVVAESEGTEVEQIASYKP